MRRNFNKNLYLRGLLQVIHLGVQRCKWKVSWGEIYGDFTLFKTQEFLESVGLKSNKGDLVDTAHYIAHKVEQVGGQKDV